MAIKQARLIYGATYAAESVNTDLFWLIRMSLPDPHVLLEFEREDATWERLLLTNSLEFTRAKKQAKNCLVMNLEDVFSRIQKRDLVLAVNALLEERGITTLLAHPLTPMEFVERLKSAGITVSLGKRPWYQRRLAKTEGEIAHILEVQGHIEDVLRLAEERLRRASIVQGLLMEGNEPLTSESLRAFIELELFQRGCASLDTIVSSGIDAALPHELGTGPLRARSGIVCDIFPYSRRTGYYSDMTRTFIKGEPPPKLLKMYKAVLRGQEKGIKMIRPGVDGKDVHKTIQNIFLEEGFETDLARGSGFVHGTGHGLGLLCHEPPAFIANGSYVLTEGVVVSVEPGLYYPDDGLGVRIEDLVVVTKDGCRNLTSYPKHIDHIVIP